MANQNELFTALQMFQNGMRDLAVSRAIGQANEVVQEIKAGEADEAEQRTQIRDVANQLAVRLFATGAPTSKIDGVFNALTGPKEPMFQTAEQAVLNSSNPDTVAKANKLLQDERQAKITQMEAGSGLKLKKERRQTLVKFQKEYNSFNFKTLNKARRQAENALKLLRSGSKLTAGAIGTMMARASEEVGNLTAAEREPFRGRQDLISRLNRMAKMAATSEIPDADKLELINLAELYLKATENSQREAAITFAHQLKANELFEDDDLGTLVRKVSGNQVEFNPQAPAPASTSAPSGGGGLNGGFRSRLKYR